MTMGLYTTPKEKRNRKIKQKIAHSYASKNKILNWHDAYAKAVFERKPYYMTQKERIDDARS